MNCIACGLPQTRSQRGRCEDCENAILPLRAVAHRKVHSAIYHGLLSHPKFLRCKDCGRQAQCYDHRDYDFPLAVDPVCWSCNSKRGPAKQLSAAA